MRVREIILAAVVLGILALVPCKSHAQNDRPVSGTLVHADSVRKGDPVGALWRSAVLPGWGQAYNGQIYKTPIIIGVIGGLVALAIYNDNQFNKFNEAFLYGVHIGEDPHPFPEFEESYNMYPGVSTSTLRGRRDSHQRSRNLAIIGAVAAYGLNILDAYVNGHLIGFDVGEDLSASIAPTFATPGATLRLRF